MTVIDSIAFALPKDELIGKFMELTDIGQTCPRYRFFVFIGILGAVVNRKVFIQRGSKETFPTLYLNPWIVLVGPQGRGNKTTSVNMGRKLLEALRPENQPRIFSSKVTPEALVKSLCSSSIAEKSIPDDILKLTRRKAIGTFIIPELGVLFGKEKYMSGLPMLLTELYDCGDTWSSETIMRSNEKLYDICFSMIAASTPDWMQKLLPKDAFEIGFMSRLMIIPLPRGWNIRKIPMQSDKRLYNTVVESIDTIAKISGELVLSIEAWDEYQRWYLNLPEIPPGPKAEHLERKQDHVLRLAGLLQLAQTQSLVLEGKYFHKALEILNSIELEVMELIDFISMEPKMKIVKKILDLVEYWGEITESELLSEVWAFLSRPAEFEEVIQLLIRARRIEWTTSGKTGTSVYRLKKKTQ
ncbi:MAG: hypothetical protein DDT19_02496 [Syntrophomonadaceae bacterium]|nr:hypothetical protein [Bacillota bacterium]